MGKFVTASIEGNEVKIVHTTRTWKSIHIGEKEIIAAGELGAYLDREKLTEFVVICDFDEYFHDILLIPALKQKYIKKVVESEIRKNLGKTNFTFIHSILGEKVVNNKKMLEVFYYMVPDEAIRNVVEKFYDHGKIVRALYPAVFIAALLVDPKASEETRMGVISAGYKRVVFTTKKGLVNFVRDYDSLETSFSDFDVQNINMTLAYCKHNLRMDPPSVTFVGDLTGFSKVKIKPDVPVLKPELPDNIECSGEPSCGYFLPCASLNANREVSILSGEFNDIYILRLLMEVATLTFTLLAILYLGLIFFQEQDVFQTKQEIQSVVSGLAETEEIYADYMNRQKKINEMIPIADFLNRPSIDIQTLLIELSGIDMKQLIFEEIDAVAETDSSFMVTIRGRGMINTYSSFQSSFEGMVNELKGIRNVELRKKEINPSDRTFSLLLRYGK